MKTKSKTKRTNKTARKTGSSHRSPSARGLNTDEQKKVTNTTATDEEIDEDRFQSLPLDDVEEEEEREKKRRVEDARREEENN